MSQTEKEMRKLLAKHEKDLPSYINPWGIRGGLFGSVLLIIVFALSIATDGINKFELIFLCLAIAASGYGLSQQQGMTNLLSAMNSLNGKQMMRMCERVNHMISLANKQDKIASKQDKLISEQKKTIEVQDELITRLRGKNGQRK